MGSSVSREELSHLRRGSLSSARDGLGEARSESPGIAGSVSDKTAASHTEASRAYASSSRASAIEGIFYREGHIIGLYNPMSETKQLVDEKGARVSYEIPFLPRNPKFLPKLSFPDNPIKVTTEYWDGSKSVVSEPIIRRQLADKIADKLSHAEIIEMDKALDAKVPPRPPSPPKRSQIGDMQHSLSTLAQEAKVPPKLTSLDEIIQEFKEAETAPTTHRTYLARDIGGVRPQGKALKQPRPVYRRLDPVYRTPEPNEAAEDEEEPDMGDEPAITPHLPTNDRSADARYARSVAKAISLLVQTLIDE